MTAYAYGVAAALLLLGAVGIGCSRNLVHAVVCLSVAQSGTYVLLLAIGYQRGAPAVRAICGRSGWVHIEGYAGAGKSTAGGATCTGRATNPGRSSTCT